MKAQVRHYMVGTHIFRITHPETFRPEEALPSLTPFALPPHGETDNGHLLFELRIETEGEPLPTPSPDGEDETGAIGFDWEDARCTIRPLPGSKHTVSITPLRTRNTYRMECRDGFGQCTARLPLPPETEPACGSEASFVLNNFLMMLYAFRAAARHTLLMHASVVAHRGKGYLFLGKSGTGKSTHTRLWLEHIPGCHLLNDDNPIVCIDPATGQATVCGSPWSGKTPCYRNEQMPAGAFVRLEQAPQNEMKKERAPQAFAALLPSCSCLKQEKGIYAGVVDTVTRLAVTVPVFHLKCLPDREAAEICRRNVEKNDRSL